MKSRNWELTAAALVVLFAIVGSIWVYGYYVHFVFHDWEKSGVFGDSFGALNVAFTGIALTGILVTIHFQRQTIEYQQNQLKNREDEELRRRSFVLFDEWNSEPVHTSRTAIHGITGGLKDVQTLSHYEKRQTKLLSTGGGDREEKRYQAEEIRKLFSVVYFLDRLSILLDSNMLDKDFTKKLFLAPVREYGEGLIRPLRSNEIKEQSPDGQKWIELLNHIDENSLKPWEI